METIAKTNTRELAAIEKCDDANGFLSRRAQTATMAIMKDMLRPSPHTSENHQSKSKEYRRRFDTQVFRRAKLPARGS